MRDRGVAVGGTLSTRLPRRTPLCPPRLCPLPGPDAHSGPHPPAPGASATRSPSAPRKEPVPPRPGPPASRSSCPGSAQEGFWGPGRGHRAPGGLPATLGALLGSLSSRSYSGGWRGCPGRWSPQGTARSRRWAPGGGGSSPPVPLQAVLLQAVLQTVPRPLSPSTDLVLGLTLRGRPRDGRR